VPAPGGAGDGKALVRIGSQTVTAPAFAAKMQIEANGQRQQGQPAIVPIPPGYNSCLSRLAALAAGAGTKPTRQSLKRQCEQLYKRYRSNVLKEVISGLWIVQGAREEGITISDEAVRAQMQTFIDSQFPSESAFQAYLSGSGETISDMLFTTKVEMLSEKVRQKLKQSVPPVSAAAVLAYYNSHLAKYEIPETREVAMIRTRKPAVVPQLRRELAAGASFASIASRLGGEQPFVAHEGLLTVTPNYLHEKALNDAIFSAKLHTLAPTVHLQLFHGYHRRFHENPNDIQNVDGDYIFEVLGIKPAHTETFPQVATKLRAELPEILLKARLVSYIKAWRARLRAETHCTVGYVVRKCEEFQPAPNEAPEDPYTLD
ncbi:MAG: peptidylprolyl isomerase, partial [Solirubrobacteraceae bacterium]